MVGKDLSAAHDECPGSVCQNAGVERLTRKDRAVAAAAAHGINEEMTIIFNSTWACIQLLEPGHPARLLLDELSAAAQRCIWKTAALLNYSTREGAYPVTTSLEDLVG